MHEPRDYEIRIRYSAAPGDDCFIAQVVEWPTITAQGDSPEQAAHEIQLALEGALALAREKGAVIPSPHAALA